MIRRRSARAEDTFQAINITPFTDVLLVLLIIFLIAGSSLTPTGVGVDQIETKGVKGVGVPNEGEQEMGPRLFVETNGDLKLRKDGELISNPDLSKIDPSEALSLTAAAGTRVELVVARYDELLRLGFQDVSLAEPQASP